MKVLGPLTDPTFPAPVYSRADQFLLRFIKDERDLPFVWLTLRITAIMPPLAVLIYSPWLAGAAWWVAVAAYFFVSNFRFKGPFGLMFHCTAHRQLFKDEYGYLNHYLPWVLGPLFGQTIEGYYSHHIGMHHPENNMPEDESSTMDYERDSFRSFLRYLGTFLYRGVADLIAYLNRKNRQKLAQKALTGELIYFGACVGLGILNLPATLVVLIVPVVIYRTVAMLGNWTQHAFVDASDPGNPYKSSVTTLNVKYNHKCWNDGYHISHHVRPAMHWTDHPAFFLKTLPKYAEHKAIVFDGLDFLSLFFCLMNKNYQKMADHFVNINNTFSSDEDLIAHLKSRTRRIPQPAEELIPA
jgi:fatty acid desaturase